MSGWRSRSRDRDLRDGMDRGRRDDRSRDYHRVSRGHGTYTGRTDVPAGRWGAGWRWRYVVAGWAGVEPLHEPLVPVFTFRAGPQPHMFLNQINLAE